MTNIWNTWKYALGSFSDDKTHDFDNAVAIIRTVILLTYLITNAFIISGVTRHWNNDNTELATPQQEATEIQKEGAYDTGRQEAYLYLSK